MQRNLRAAALLASLQAIACWSSSKPTTADPDESGQGNVTSTGTTAGAQTGGAAASRASAACVEGGERLVVQICQRDDDLDWTATNRADVPLWVFVAPPAGPIGGLDRANAIAMMSDGKLLLRKFQVQPIGGELVFVGAVLLAPGETDSGRVPLGARLNTSAKNFAGAYAKGATIIQSVVLEVGFADQRRGDQAEPASRGSPFMILTRFDRSRQQFARTPALSWR